MVSGGGGNGVGGGKGVTGVATGGEVEGSTQITAELVCDDGKDR